MQWEEKGYSGEVGGLDFNRERETSSLELGGKKENIKNITRMTEMNENNG